MIRTELPCQRLEVARMVPVNARISAAFQGFDVLFARGEDQGEGRRGKSSNHGEDFTLFLFSMFAVKDEASELGFERVKARNFDCFFEEEQRDERQGKEESGAGFAENWSVKRNNEPRNKAGCVFFLSSAKHRSRHIKSMKSSVIRIF